MDVSGQLHAPTTLPQEAVPGLDFMEKRKIPCRCRESNPDFSFFETLAYFVYQPSYPGSQNNKIFTINSKKVRMALSISIIIIIIIIGTTTLCGSWPALKFSPATPLL
jgi:hypothetical protein